MPKTVPALPGIPPSTLPFSQVVEANGFVFLAGQVRQRARQRHRRARRHRGRDAPDARQRRGACSTPSGLDYGDVVKATVYLRDFGEFARDERRLPRVLPDRAARPGRRSA